ncbi:IclR family transcriptional regulator C-terminal domain-containing protein [Maritimibacter sp. UBA3975]|mgnify:CR=1 FL=1|uniref:IclR family transcriptional regulator n=1 Tax=Maritimibacter sp. UBA3975 TaxID=1946833 RepID=UPI000C0ACD1B|nr:IclR family transcriptional regulator C-terminal domain-containing protein [Maritimibacter sp. UBA3975]MAM62245.1 IclR family transcriptional regulator [Maritimibacter sp.]|tara:strand:- start:1727 stop:2512 length:786 start_codon:yes stop_codon:yes gene_type:complete
MSAGAGSAERILGILDLFSENRLEWTPDEMMAELGYTRPTLYRYIKTLKDAGFLTQNGPHGLTLGPRVVELDFLMRKSDALLLEGGTVLKKLAARHPSTALLVRWYGNKLLCVASEVSTPEPKSSYPRGRPMPLARGAISRAILAHLPRRQMLAKIHENLADLRELGLGDTVDEIAEALRQMRKGGALVARGEVTDGVVGIAAPVFDASRAPVAVLCMTVDRDTLDDRKLQELSDVIWAAGTQLSDALTHMRVEDVVLGEL